MVGLAGNRYLCDCTLYPTDHMVALRTRQTHQRLYPRLSAPQLPTVSNNVANGLQNIQPTLDGIFDSSYVLKDNNKGVNDEDEEETEEVEDLNEDDQMMDDFVMERDRHMEDNSLDEVEYENEHEHGDRDGDKDGDDEGHGRLNFDDQEEWELSRLKSLSRMYITHPIVSY